VPAGRLSYALLPVTIRWSRWAVKDEQEIPFD
jgi:hypothetical protein